MVRLKLTEISSFQLFQVFRLGSLLLGAVLLANSGLGRAMIGSFELYLYLGTTLSFFWVNGLMQGFLRFGSKLESALEKQQFYQGAYLFLLLAASILAVSLHYFGEGTIAELLSIGIRLPLLDLYAIYLLLHLPAFLAEHYLLLEKRSFLLRQYAGYQFGGYLMALAIPVFSGGGIAQVFQGLIVWSMGKHLFLLRLFFWKKTLSLDLEQQRSWLIVSLPLVAYALIGGVHDSFDSWLVNRAFGGDPEIFALYRYGARELPVVMVLSAALSTAMIPVLTQKGKEGHAMLKARATQLMHLLFPLSVFLLLSSDYWFPLLFSETFRDSIPVFNTLVLVLLSRLLFPQAVMIALGQQKTMLKVAVVELLLNMSLSMILVRYWGLQGIIAGTLIAYLFEKITYMVLLYKGHGIAPKTYHNWKVWTIYSAITLLVYAYRSL